MKTILLTGGTGFLGSKIKESFQNAGYTVIAPRRGEALEVLFAKNAIDTIIHTATCYGRNNETWPEIAEANLILPLNLLSLGEKYGVPNFINADTFFNSKIKFEKKEEFYVQTKKDFLEIARHALPSLKMRFSNLRIEQMYGPNDNPKKFIPTIIKQLLDQQTEIQLTKGEQKRDFIYIDDVVKFFLNIFEKQDSLEKYIEFGIGSGSSVPIKEVVLYLKQLTGSASNLNFGAIPYRNNEIMDSSADISNTSRFGWKPEIDWKEGLKRTVEYYRK